jgi:hypothetical protein
MMGTMKRLEQLLGSAHSTVSIATAYITERELFSARPKQEVRLPVRDSRIRARAIQPMRTLLLGLLVGSLTGCASIKHTTSHDFKNITHLRQLDGEYRNECVSDDGRPWGQHLSNLIWGEKSGLDHEAIQSIAVLTTDEYTIDVTAWSGRGIERQSRFVVGKDVDISSGRIVLKSGVIPIGDDAGVGVAADKVTLGLDTDNQGKYRSSGTGVAIEYLIPFAMSEVNECSFPRLEPGSCSATDAYKNALALLSEGETFRDKADYEKANRVLDAGILALGHAYYSRSTIDDTGQKLASIYSFTTPKDAADTRATVLHARLEACRQKKAAK